jgi:porin
MVRTLLTPVLSRACASLGLALVLLLAGVGAAGAETARRPAEPRLFGDMEWRTKVFDKGIDFQLVHVSESAYNLGGGTKQLVDYTDQVAVGTTFDLERIVGLHDAVIQVTYTSRAGRNLVDDAQLGTFQLVQEVWGRGQTVRLTQMWFEQKYLNDLINWKFGRVSMGGDFATFPCDFQNLTFCGSQPGNIAGGYIFNWPISQWGSRVKVNLEGFGHYQIGVYDQNQQYLGYENKLLPVWYQGSTGVLVPVEIAWNPKFAGGRLEGSYKFGAWYSSGQQPDTIYDINNNVIAFTGLPAATRTGMYGAYVAFQQQIIRTSDKDPNRGVRLFFNAAFADTVTATTDRQIAAGFWYTGPFESRPNDAIAFAVGTTHQNQRITQVAMLQNALGLGPVPVKDSEYVFELDYTFVPVPGFQIRPNLQYIYSPGGSVINKDVWVVGLKTVISF